MLTGHLSCMKLQVIYRNKVLNEEGFPIIEISEPVVDSEARHAHEDELSDVEMTEQPDVTPLAMLSDEERARVQARCNRILDILEAEEEKELMQEADREDRERREELAKMESEARAERERKLAQREMQKKMGKALLRNFAEARAKDDKEKAEMLASPVAGPSSCPTSPGGARKPKKKVSFANLPDIDEDKPKLEQEKSHITLGDVSIGILKGNTRHVRLKKDELANLPMKLEVVERVPGEWRKTTPLEEQEDGDSDDESLPEEASHPHAGDNDDSEDDDGNWRSYGNMKDEDDEDDLETLSQAQLQREVALNYIEKRNAIGADLQELVSSDGKGEHDWDSPEVPLDATLAARPPKSRTSRFKASLQGASSDSNTLPSGQSHLLVKTVRNGKLLPEGTLSGGVEGDSDPEDVDETQTMRALEMLMRGEVVPEASLKGDSNSQPGNSTPSEPSPRQPSMFAARRQFANDVSNSSRRPTAAKSPESLSPNTPPSPFRKPPTVISTPNTASTTALKKVVASTSQPQANSFSSMIVDSPSFPAPPGSFSSVIVDSPSFPQPTSSRDQVTRPTALADQVQEHTPGRTPTASENLQKPLAKVSRFKSARS